jgi:hypothetical protein
MTFFFRADIRHSAIIVFKKTILGSSFLTLFPVSRYTSSDAGCSILDAG